MDQYEPEASGIDARAFGYKADWNGNDLTATDNSGPLQAAINFAAVAFGTGFDTGGGAGNIIHLPTGTAKFNSMVVVHDGVQVVGKGTYGTVLKMATSFSPSSHMFRLGTFGDPSAICASQSRGSAGNLVINGSLASAGVVNFLAKRIVSIYSVGNNSGVTFTITGLDGAGNPVSDVLAGPNDGKTDSVVFFSRITQVSVSGATTGTVTVGHETRASFSCVLENAQLFSANVNAGPQVAMVYTNNAQHTGGARKLKIFGGNRVCLLCETGVGGASDITIEHIETFNHGNFAGVTANNPQIYINYAGLTVSMHHIIQGGPGPGGGAAAKGVYIDGGFVYLQHYHMEGTATGIFNAIPNLNAGCLRVRNANGGPGMSTLVHIDSTVDPDTTVLGMVFPNGATRTVQDDTPAGAGSVTGNIIVDTVF